MRDQPLESPGEVRAQLSSSDALTGGDPPALHLARLAAHLLGAPVALVASLGQGSSIRLHLSTLGPQGIPGSSFNNARAICEYVVRSGETLLISNILEGADHAGEVGTMAISYAGVPISFDAASPTGALCVMDRRVRDWTAAEAELLHEIAGAIAALPHLDAYRRETRLRKSHEFDAIGRLAGGIAHDFNNLFTAIKGHADLLLDEVSTIDPLRRDLEEIRNSTERAAFLTQQLLAFSRRLILQPRLLDLRRLIPEWIERARGDLQIGLRIDPAIDRIMADPDQIERAIGCIVANAREAVRDGGEVTVTASNTTLDEATSRSFPYTVEPGPYVRIAISDTGHGMDPETLERIFEPYFTTREPPLAMGLGLSTAYGIVKQSGGYIWATSEPAQGTTLEILLPSHPGPMGLRPPDPAPEPAPAPETILLVEDEQIVRSLVQRILTSDGYEVLVAADGNEALRIAHEHPERIHLLLTDLSMPGMSGRELAARITEIRPDLRVLFISGYTDDEDFRQAGNLFGSFLEKPFTPEDLKARVREVLD